MKEARDKEIIPQSFKATKAIVLTSALGRTHPGEKRVCTYISLHLSHLVSSWML